jgi:hypothetical protein
VSQGAAHLRAGYTVAIAGIFTMLGGMVTLTLAHYTLVHRRGRGNDILGIERIR